MKKTKSLTQVINENLKDHEFKELYNRELLINKVARMVIDLRNKAGLTQAELAERIGTKQPVIARLESGSDSRMPSLDLLTRIATVSKCNLDLNFSRKE